MNNIKINSVLQEHLDQKEIKKVASDLCVMVYSDRTLADGRVEEMIEYISMNYKDVYEKLMEKCDEAKFPLISKDKELNVTLNEDSFSDALFALENNFCFERIEDIKTLGKRLYGKPEQKRVIEKEKEVQPRPSGPKKLTQESGVVRRGKSKRSPSIKKNQGGLIIGIAVVIIVIVIVGVVIVQNS